MAERSRVTTAKWIGAGIALAVAGGSLWLLCAPGPDGRLAGIREDTPVPVSPRAPGPAGWRIPLGKSVAISAAEVARAGPGATLPVDLELSVAERSGEPIRGRILSFDVNRENRERPLRGRIVGEDQMRARTELPADFLLPGLYLIELRTTERNTPLPLVRYRLEVR